jgi:hypothetical protein
LPATLLYQLTRLINIFYLANACLEQYMGTSDKTPLASFLPSACIILAGVIREIIVEIGRYRDDHRINGLRVRKLSNFGMKKKKISAPLGSK